MTGRRRRRSDEAGFSLVELLVVVIILGALATIAISTYLSQRGKAERASAVSTLSSMRLAAESIRSDNDDRFSRVPSRYETEQAAYTYVSGADASTGPSVVSVGPAAPPDGDTVAFAVRSQARCYYLRLETGSAAMFRAAADVDGATVRCQASEYLTGADTGWD